MHALVRCRRDQQLRRELGLPGDCPAAVSNLGKEGDRFRVFKLGIDGTVRAGQRQTAVPKAIDVDRQSLTFHEVARLLDDRSNGSLVIVRQLG